MKNTIRISFVFILIMFVSIIFTNLTYATTITLTDIVTKFNAEVADLVSSGLAISATEDNNTIITTTIDSDGNPQQTIFTLTNNILESTIANNNLSGAMCAQILIKSIAQLHGYSNDYITAILTLDEIKNYTVDNQGFCITPEGNNVIIKINMQSMNLTTDMSTIFIQPSDLEDLKEYISGDGSAQTSKGYLVLNKGGYGNEVSFFIGENNDLTNNTYKSILSVLEVMFGSTAVPNYFSTKYPNLSNGNSEFDGIKIEINPVKTTMETFVLKDTNYKFVRVTINKSTVLSAKNTATTIKSADTTTKIADPTIATISKIPQSGRVFEIIDLLKLILISSIFLLILLIIYNRKRDKQTT